jgi:hypothetical protein
MYTSPLLSNYDAVVLMGLREAGNKPFNPKSTLSTYALEYFVEYTTLNDALRYNPGLRHPWNVLKDGFPTSGNLATWSRNHELHARDCGVNILVCAASLYRSSNGEKVAEVVL